MIAIPTDAFRCRVLHERRSHRLQRHVKQMYSHPIAVPKAVILDPAATLETPIDLLLSTGMRAVDHAVEGWCSVRAAPIADACNRESMRLLADSLARIRRDAGDLEARSLAQHGMWLSRIATMAGIPLWCESRHWLSARRRARRSARHHVLHNASGRADLERVFQCARARPR
jgi:alcohol dehydrogenase YqhD (iron-dependent ADH family)